MEGIYWCTRKACPLRKKCQSYWPARARGTQGRAGRAPPLASPGLRRGFRGRIPKSQELSGFYSGSRTNAVAAASARRRTHGSRGLSGPGVCTHLLRNRSGTASCFGGCQEHVDEAVTPKTICCLRSNVLQAALFPCPSGCTEFHFHFNSESSHNLSEDIF